MIRYPVFRDGKNYAGSSPKIMGQPLLRRYAETEFVHEIAKVPDALILPLGKSVKEVLAALVAVDCLDAERILARHRGAGSQPPRRVSKRPRAKPSRSDGASEGRSASPPSTSSFSATRLTAAARLWTLDRRLGAAAEHLGTAYPAGIGE